MWPFIEPIRLIRYLFVCQVNRSWIKTTDPLNTELPWALASVIANRLPSIEAVPWNEALALLNPYRQSLLKSQKKVPPTPHIDWPIEAVYLTYPHKFSYGPAEHLLWELKLLGPSADHNLFLELILPAVEALSCTSDRHLYRQNGLWGRFDIRAIYAARGLTWEPVVEEGQLDLTYRPTSYQWAEGLDFGLVNKPSPNSMIWVTNFQFEDPSTYPVDTGRKKRVQPEDVPTLAQILEALLTRVAQLLPDRRRTVEMVWDICGQEEETRFTEMMALAQTIKREYYHLNPAPKHTPGMWHGILRFDKLPLLIVPYLELASILHIGYHTHFGCGTFTIRDYKK